ncbi:dimethylaniline monooxygenase [Crotalus adamanteus]|uniref:Flavin-containing monooxygenase n=1 Tax=Crotalus adamanteus TaxID=8729 RepID=A0AAW1BNN3_CROAD
MSRAFANGSGVCRQFRAGAKLPGTRQAVASAVRMRGCWRGKSFEKFKGKIIHSWAYKNFEKYQDQRILIVGLGNSGVEIAIDLSHITKQVFLSTRTGAWVVNRVSDGGYPFDVVHFTRFKNLLFHKLPVVLINQWGEKKLNMKFNHENYGVKPQHRFLSKTPIIGDDLPNAIIAGRVVMKPHVKKFTERGATMPISELQVRWATRVFKGLNKLPSNNDMMADIAKKIQYNEKRHAASHNNFLIVHYIDYMDELASLLGVKPKLLSLLLTDPKLAWEIYFGPCSAAQFRLTGPGKWKGARNAILTQRERIIKATKTRPLQSSTNSKLSPNCCSSFSHQPVSLRLQSLWWLPPSVCQKQQDSTRSPSSCQPSAAPFVGPARRLLLTSPATAR